MARRVDHIGILVSNMDEAIKLYKDCFDAEVDKIETLAERGVKAAILSLGQGANLELLEPLPDSNMAEVLEKRVDKELSHLSKRGIELIDKKARPGFEGMVAFIHPKSLRGVLVELCQKA
jgi:methylmalonyl-CoA/ethylmalonyl-CoA epimerase